MKRRVAENVLDDAGRLLDRIDPHHGDK